jgi:hypothetical protein
MSYSSNYAYYHRSYKLSLSDCKAECVADRDCLLIVHHTSCHLYHSPCNCGYNRDQRKYIFNRNRHANQLALHSNTAYHLSTCSAKCTATSGCNEFTVRNTGHCELWKACPKYETTGARVSDHYRRVDCQMIDRCNTDPNTITNISWNTKYENKNPTRSNTKLLIPDFKFSNSDCKLMSYTLMGHDPSKVWISGSNVEYKTNIQEPFTHKFDLLVNAVGGSRFGKFPSTIQLNGCPIQNNTISIRRTGSWPNWTS